MVAHQADHHWRRPSRVALAGAAGFRLSLGGPDGGGACEAEEDPHQGLAAAGLHDVPVAALSPESINPQPGFIIDKKGLLRRMGLGVIFTDPLARMYLATVVREKQRGIAKAVHTKYLKK